MKIQSHVTKSKRIDFVLFYVSEMSVFTHLVTDSAEFHIEYYNWKGIQTIIVCAFYGKVPKMILNPFVNILRVKIIHTHISHDKWTRNQITDEHDWRMMVHIFRWKHSLKVLNGQNINSAFHVFVTQYSTEAKTMSFIKRVPLRWEREGGKWMEKWKLSQKWDSKSW